MMKLASIEELELAHDFATEFTDVMSYAIQGKIAPDGKDENRAIKDRVDEFRTIFVKVERTILLARANLRMQLNGKHVTALQALGQAYIEFTRIALNVTEPSQIKQSLWGFSRKFNLQLMLGDVLNEIALAILYVKESERDSLGNNGSASDRQKNPLELWDDAVRKKMNTGLSENQAKSAVDREQPFLRLNLLKHVNNVHIKKYGDKVPDFNPVDPEARIGTPGIEARYVFDEQAYKKQYPHPYFEETNLGETAQAGQPAKPAGHQIPKSGAKPKKPNASALMEMYRACGNNWAEVRRKHFPTVAKSTFNDWTPPIAKQ